MDRPRYRATVTIPMRRTAPPYAGATPPLPLASDHHAIPMSVDPQSLTRREALQRTAAILGTSVSVPTLLGVLAGCERSRSTAPGDSWKPQTLDLAQDRLVTAIAEHILPETDTPGARSAGANRFIDAMLTGYYPEEERRKFIDGLAGVDGLARRTHQKGFLELPEAQQVALLSELDRRAFAKTPAPQPAVVADRDPVTRENQVDEGRGKETNAATAKSGAVATDKEVDVEDTRVRSFFKTMKELTIVGYYTSEAAATHELRVNPMGAYRADIPYASIGHAWI